MTKNIRFYYIHRDSGNYKNFGHKDFSNPKDLSVDAVRERVEQSLIDGIYFYPEEVGIKKFRFHRYCDDYSWYEMERLEVVEGKTKKETIDDFINLLSFPEKDFRR